MSPLEQLEDAVIKEAARAPHRIREAAEKLLENLPDQVERIELPAARAAARAAVQALTDERDTVLRLGEKGTAAALIRIGVGDVSSVELTRRTEAVTTLDDAIATSEASSEYVARKRDAELQLRRDIAGLAGKVGTVVARTLLPLVLGGLR